MAAHHRRNPPYPHHEFFSSEKVELPKHNPVLAYALEISALQKPVGKRVILASISPRRRETLQTFVRSSDMRCSLQATDISKGVGTGGLTLYL